MTWQQQAELLEEAVRKAHRLIVKDCKPYTPEILGVLAVLSDAILAVEIDALS
jgi:hypothetical protein